VVGNPCELGGQAGGEKAEKEEEKIGGQAHKRGVVYEHWPDRKVFSGPASVMIDRKDKKLG
jgi:hypothetical protein